MNNEKLLLCIGVLSAMVACTPMPEPIPGPRGDPGPAGPMGPPGTAGAPGRDAVLGVYWVDANGVEISPVTAQTPVYIDPDGFTWRIDQETGEISAFSVPAENINLYESDNCGVAGPLMAFPTNPRVAFRAEGDPPGRFRARGDRGQAALKLARSWRAPDGACSPSPYSSAPVPTVPMPGLRNESIPSPGFFGPLHQQIQ